MKQLFVLNKYFWRYRWRFLLGIIFVASANYFAVLIPQKIGEALDYVSEKIVSFKELEGAARDAMYSDLTEALMIFGLTVVGFAIMKGIFMYFMRQTIIVNSRLIEYDLRKDIFDHFEKLDLGFYKTHKTGDLMARISEDVNKVRMYLGPAVLYGINLTSLFVLTIIAMFRVDPVLSMYTLVPLPFLSLSIYIVSSKIHDKSTEIQQQLSHLNSIAQEVYSGISVIKSYVKEKQFGAYFDEESGFFKKKSLELARVNALFFPLMILLVSLSTVIVVYVGGMQVQKGVITPGVIAEFIIYVGMLTWPVTAIGWIASIIQQAEASQRRINELLDTDPAIKNKPQFYDAVVGSIEFRNVSFTYAETGIQALDNVSFKLEAGQKMAILGRTASGKTTIADLLLRLYDCQEGEILIDGKNIQDFNLVGLRRSIGYVPQDIFLFSDTISQNVAFGKDRTNSEEIEKYTRYAAVYDDIVKLPEGFDTRIGERGVTLSGGQKQRVSMARAFIKEPQIVILDDSLSAVDTSTEQQILSYMNESLHNKTAIIITHRLQNMNEFDLIMVLEDGQTAQIGNHETLSSREGYYSEMLQNQLIGEEESNSLLK